MAGIKLKRSGKNLNSLMHKRELKKQEKNKYETKIKSDKDREKNCNFSMLWVS